MPTDAMLRIERARVSFDGFVALDVDRFAVGRNELRVVIGPNGAGKTTLCDVISGKTRLKAGRVFFSGDDVTDLRDFEIARRGIARKFQTPSVFGSLTVFENLELAACAPIGGGSAKPRSSHDERPRVVAVAEIVGLQDSLDVAAQYLSHGQRQALEIGMLVVTDTKLLLLDEPAAGLSDAETAAMVTLLKDLAQNRTLIVIEHDMDFVRELGAHITVLHEGRILAEGPLTSIQSDARVVEVYLGR